MCVKTEHACLSLSHRALLTTAVVLWLPQHGTPLGMRLDCRIHPGGFGGVPPDAFLTVLVDVRSFHFPPARPHWATQSVSSVHVFRILAPEKRIRCLLWIPESNSWP